MNKSRWSDVTEAELADQYGRRLVRQAQIPARMEQAAKRVPRGTFDYADTLKQQVALVGLPEPTRDHRFDPIRRWRMDLAWVDLKISCEVDGSEGTHGRHGRPAGMRSDCEKLNAALLAGWKPYRFTGSQVQSGYALGILERALKASEAA